MTRWVDDGWDPGEREERGNWRRSGEDQRFLINNLRADDVVAGTKSGSQKARHLVSNRGGREERLTVL